MTDRGVVVLERAVAYDGHFKIIRYRLRHRLFAGGMSRELTREVFERGHAVAVLPFDPARNQVVLVEQFRIGTLGVVDEPWLLEPVAGIIESGESALDVARREAAEEAGLELLELVPACTYFASPGGSTETCRVFIGRVDAAGAGGIHGLADEGEDIRVHVVDLDTALEGLCGGGIHAATTVIALQWLALHRAELQERWKADGAGDDGSSCRSCPSSE
jgi:ADP-ribose pyrophosphatase